MQHKKQSEQKQQGHRMIINDGITGKRVTLFFRTPTASEWVEYEENAFQRTPDGKMKFNSSQAKLDAGIKLITGVSEGALMDTEGRPVSSDPASPDFRDNWKTILMDTRINLVSVFATHIFQTTSVVEDGDQVPFGKS